MGAGRQIYLYTLTHTQTEYAPSIDVIINETLPALQKAREAGKIKMIGMTGYPMEVQREIISRSSVKIDTCLSYCHYSMNDTTLLNYLPFLREKDVALVNASPISMGLLSNRCRKELLRVLFSSQVFRTSFVSIRILYNISV